MTWLVAQIKSRQLAGTPIIRHPPDLSTPASVTFFYTSSFFPGPSVYGRHFTSLICHSEELQKTYWFISPGRNDIEYVGLTKRRWRFILQIYKCDKHLFGAYQLISPACFNPHVMCLRFLHMANEITEHYVALELVRDSCGWVDGWGGSGGVKRAALKTVQAPLWIRCVFAFDERRHQV